MDTRFSDLKQALNISPQLNTDEIINSFSFRTFLRTGEAPTASLLIEAVKIIRKFNANQSRVPAGSPNGGQWIGNSGSTSNAPSFSGDLTDIAGDIQSITSNLDEICEKLYERDIFQCSMVGLASCYNQAMARFAACLRGQPLPPFSY